MSTPKSPALHHAVPPWNVLRLQKKETFLHYNAGYPGFGLPLTYNPQGQHDFYPLGAHPSCWDSDSDILPVRELAMMSIMEQLSDKDDWSRKIFDDQIVAKWRREALSIPDKELWGAAFRAKAWAPKAGQLPEDDEIDWIKPLEGIISSQTFDCCIQELRSKAKYYEQTGIIPTLDACASVAKSDNMVSPELHNALRLAFAQLKADQTPDWHPNSNDMVQDLVHPSMYPLVYGRSRVVLDEVVGVRDAINAWAGKGDVIPKPTRPRDQSNRFGFIYNPGGSEVPPEFWSETYQWLPSNIAVQEGGSVRFTSYINNLHPNKYPGIYRTIESLLETALPMWDQCLSLSSSHVPEGKIGAGRTESRFPIPENPDDENPENWIPSHPDEITDEEINAEELEDYDPDFSEDPEESARQAKWLFLRKPRIPKPTFQDVDYTPKPGYRLVEKFRNTGLQVIVKMASIELTPEKPEFPAGGWHVEGQMNEHICATALYYLDSDNITSSSLSFRMQTSTHFNDDYQYNVGQDAYHWMESIYGTGFGGGASPCLQNYGEVQTREGRLLAFPNVFQHRVSPFRLIDPTKPGHRRFIALWLVDPNKRIISTANVPPQQLSWWIEAVLGSSDADARAAALSRFPPELLALLEEKGVDVQSVPKEGRLPPELMAMVREYFEEEDSNPLGMTEAEAQQHRLELMRERTNHQVMAGDSWQDQTYNFCEH